MKNVYGVTVGDGKTHIDVSLSERGAKNYATRHNCQFVSVRKNGGYDAFIIAYKGRSRTGKCKWKKYV